MIMRFTRMPAALALSALASTVCVRAQNTLLVPSQFAEIGAAVAAASPGDIIQVADRAQRYQPFVLDKSVTIVGHAGEHRAPTVAVTQGIGIDAQLAPGERAVMSRIDVLPVTGALATAGMRIRGGAVTLADCRFHSGDDASATVAVVDAADTELTATFCRFLAGAGGTALRAVNSYVALQGTRCFAGAHDSTEAVAVTDCVLHATACTMLGNGPFVVGTSHTALRVAGNSQVTVQGGMAMGGIGSPGGPGLINTGANAVEHTADAFVGGLDFVTLTPGPATVGPTLVNPGLVGLLWSEPPYRRGTLQRGQPWGATAHTAPGSLAAIAFAFSPQGFAPLFSRQPAILPTDIALLVPTQADGNGLATVGGVLADDPALSGAVLWAQAIAISPFPLEVSPPSAVVVR